MAEDVIDALTRVQGLHVVARTSSFRFRGRGLDLREVGEKLGVSTVLEGSVRKAGNRVRISARLVNIGNGYDLWSERYDRELDDIFALQDEISRAIVDTLKAKLVTTTRPASAPAVARPKHQPTPEVYELFLKARFYSSAEHRDGLTAAGRTLRQALELDPEFAQAHASLASVYVALFAYGLVSPAEAGEIIDRHSRRALEIDDGLADAHRTFGAYNCYIRWDWAATEAALRRAMELDPGSSRIHRARAMNLLAPLGRLEEAIEDLRASYRLDPLDPVASRNLAENLYWSGRHEESLRQFQHTLEMGPSPLARGEIAAVYSALGQPEKALEIRLEDLRSAGRLDAADAVEKAFAGSGEEGVYRWYLAELEKRAETRSVSPLSRALLHAVLGEVDAAFRWLEEAFEQRFGLFVYVKVNPWFAPLHDDPRWAALLGRMGVA